MLLTHLPQCVYVSVCACVCVCLHVCYSFLTHVGSYRSSSFMAVKAASSHKRTLVAFMTVLLLYFYWAPYS